MLKLGILTRPVGIGIRPGIRNGLTVCVGIRTVAKIDGRDLVDVDVADIAVLIGGCVGKRSDTAGRGELDTTVKTKPTTSRTAAAAAVAVVARVLRRRRGAETWARIRSSMSGGCSAPNCSRNSMSISRSRCSSPRCITVPPWPSASRCSHPRRLGRVARGNERRSRSYRERPPFPHAIFPGRSAASVRDAFSRLAR